MLKKSINSRMKKYSTIGIFAALLITLIGLSCVEKSKVPASPPGYDINKPKKYNMPDILQEISGIAFDQGDNKIVYAEQDEEGSLFRLLKISKDLLPKGEYEAIYADESTGKVYVLCKSCKQDKGTNKASGYVLSFQSDGTLKTAGTFVVDGKDIDKLSGKKKSTFHPSALALHPLTNEWYIVSSVNKALIVTDKNWKIKNVYHLSTNVYNQPEGIAFDKQGNLYISNEGSETTVGNILRFDYKKP